MVAWPSLFVLLFWSVSFAAGAFSGKLVKVVDGDTVEVLRSGRAERVRLTGIDAPEEGQPFSRSARAFVATAAGKTVTVQERGRDRYGRLLGEVILPDGRSLNRELVRAGLAWWYRAYSRDPDLARLEAAARAGGRGLWSAPNPVPPWEWRRGARAKAGEQRKPAPPARWKCGSKRACAEMTSCEEAKFYLQACGVTELDRDNDGIPCEALCR